MNDDEHECNEDQKDHEDRDEDEGGFRRDHKNDTETKIYDIEIQSPKQQTRSMDNAEGDKQQRKEEDSLQINFPLINKQFGR